MRKYLFHICRKIINVCEKPKLKALKRMVYLRYVNAFRRRNFEMEKHFNSEI